MKRLQLFTLFLFSICTVYANTDPHQDLIQYLSRSEYFINWHSQTGTYESPNRKNQLRAVYTAEAMNITPQNADAWSFSLTLKGIATDDRVLYKAAAAPFVSMHENTIRFNHANQFTVEYVNNEQGIRQNFIVQDPGVKVRTLSVLLSPAAGWEVLAAQKMGVVFKQKHQVLTYNDLKVWDAKGKCLPAEFIIKNKQVEIRVAAANAVYPITIDPIVLNGTPLNANTFLQSNQVNGFMGISASTGGDINGDGYDDVVVGAGGYDKGQTDEGAVFVYYGSSRGINPTTYTLLEGNVANRQFGTAVSGGGDVNDDGFDDVVVGIPAYSADSTNSKGVVFVFYGSAAGLNTTPDTVEADYERSNFGLDVAIAKDINGDACDDIIVGASSLNHGQIAEGAFTVIYGGYYGVSYTPHITIEGNVIGLSLGTSVSGAGDVNGDGYNDVIVGASDHAIVYYGSDAGLDEAFSTTLTSSLSYAHFGSAVAGGGDINGDGFDDILLGDPNYSNTHLSQGAVFIFNGSAAGVTTTPALIMEGNQDTALYGARIAFAGDINNDGYSDIIVGAYLAENVATQNGEGFAYVYYGRASGLNPVPASTIQANQSSALLGWSVDGAGDVNGDGYSDVIVGSLLYTNGQSFEGGAFIYHGGAASAGLLSASPASLDELAVSSSESVTHTRVSVKAFPNPVVNNLTVQLQGLNAKQTTFIQVINTQGILVKVIKAGNISDGMQAIDVSGFTPGVYYVVVQNGENVLKEKIIKN